MNLKLLVFISTIKKTEYYPNDDLLLRDFNTIYQFLLMHLVELSILPAYSILNKKSWKNYFIQ